MYQLLQEHMNLGYENHHQLSVSRPSKRMVTDQIMRRSEEKSALHIQINRSKENIATESCDHGSCVSLRNTRHTNRSSARAEHPSGMLMNNQHAFCISWDHILYSGHW